MSSQNASYFPTPRSAQNTFSLLLPLPDHLLLFKPQHRYHHLQEAFHASVTSLLTLSLYFCASLTPHVYLFHSYEPH